MEIAQNGIDLVKHFEGLYLTAYPDPATHAEPFTIGYGTTVYPDGSKVKLGESISLQQAEDYLKYDLNVTAQQIEKLITSTLTQNQIDSLISFSYNVGVGSLRRSTLRKKVNSNPSDSSIKDEFMKWNKGNGKIMRGLTLRREAEAELYFRM